MPLTRAEANAASTAAFKYIVEEVLVQGRSGNVSLLMNALEQSGINNIYTLVAITESEIQDLKADIDGVMTPLIDGTRSLPRIFRCLTRHRIETNDPINGNWTSITAEEFNEFRIGIDLHLILDKIANPGSYPTTSQTTTRSSTPRDDEATEFRQRTKDEAIELRKERDHNLFLFQQKQNEKSEQFSEAIKNATFPLELPPPPQNKIVETTIQSLPPSFDPATINLIVETKIEKSEPSSSPKNAPFLDELPPPPQHKIVETTIQSLPPSFDLATRNLIVETKIEKSEPFSSPKNVTFPDELPPPPQDKIVKMTTFEEG
jgi:hypothetical protein